MDEEQGLEEQGLDYEEQGLERTGSPTFQSASFPAFLLLPHRIDTTHNQSPPSWGSLH